MDLRDTRLGRWYFGLLRGSMLKWIGGALGPDQMTLLGLALAAAVPLGFAASPPAGLVLLGLSALADTLDGQLAKAQGGGSRFGAFLDSAVDRASDGFYLTGFWVAGLQADQSPVPSALALFAALVLTGLISYTKARIEGLGGTCSVGLMDRALRTVYLLVWALVWSLLPGWAPAVFWTGLSLYLLLVLTTVLQRVQAARQLFRA